MTIPPHDDLQGWLSDAEGAALQELARGKRVLEIGSWKGRSAVSMALGGALHVYCLDHFKGDSYTGNVSAVETFRQFSENVEKFGVQDRISVLLGRSDDLLAVIDFSFFDLIYYDADHTHEATRKALTYFELFASEGSIWAVHDYDKKQPQYTGVIASVDETIQRTGRSLRVVDRLAILEP